MEITERHVAFTAQTGIIGLAECGTSIGGFVGGSGDGFGGDGEQIVDGDWHTFLFKEV